MACGQLARVICIAINVNRIYFSDLFFPSNFIYFFVFFSSFSFAVFNYLSFYLIIAMRLRSSCVGLLEITDVIMMNEQGIIYASHWGGVFIT